MKIWTNLHSKSDLIIYEGTHFIVVNKPPGVATQDDLSGDLSVSTWLEKHKKKQLHLVTRLDRPVSGAVLFSKTKEGNMMCKDRTSITKRYVAFTKPTTLDSSQLSHYINRDGRRKKAYISEEPKEGYKACSLEFQVIQQLDNYSMLEIQTMTGRFHQIRAQLSHAGLPIRGDVKYGARRANKDRSIGLHNYKLTIPNVETPIIALPIGREKIWEQLIAHDIVKVQ